MHKGKATKSFGITWKFNLFVQAKHFFKGLSGMIAYAEENYEKAISLLKQSILNDAFESYHLALAYIKIGDETNAIKYLESAVNYSLNINLQNEIARGRAEKLLNQLKDIKL